MLHHYGCSTNVTNQKHIFDLQIYNNLYRFDE